jgi:hypothetical protein
MRSRVVTIVLAVGVAFSGLALVQRLSGYRLPGNQQGYEPDQPIAFSHRLHAGELQISCQYCHGGSEKSRHAGVPAASVCMNCHKHVTAPLTAVRAEDERAKSAGRAHLIAQAFAAQGLASQVAVSPVVPQVAVPLGVAAFDASALRPPRRVVSPELQKLYDALGLDEKMQPAPGKSARAIPWVRVHNLPDHACFDHRAHVSAGVACQKCHGPVETMERVRQVEDLSMGWCVNCHREVNRTGVSGKKVRASTDCSACHY